MDTTGWIVAAGLALFVLGMLAGVRAKGSTTVINNYAPHAEASASAGDGAPAPSPRFPIGMLAALGAVALVALPMVQAIPAQTTSQEPDTPPVVVTIIAPTAVATAPPAMQYAPDGSTTGGNTNGIVLAAVGAVMVYLFVAFVKASIGRRGTADAALPVGQGETLFDEAVRQRAGTGKGDE